MANLAVPSWLLFAGIAAETTWNTPVAATDFYPLMKPDFDVIYEPIEDDGFRSNASALQAWYQGVVKSQVSLPDMLFYPNASGHLLMGIFGADAITGTNPYTHTMTLLNTAYPKSYTVGKYPGLVATQDQVAGLYFEEVALKFANPGKLTISAKGQGTVQTQATKATNTYDASSVFLPWQAAVTLGGSSTTKVINAELTLKRPVEVIWGFSGAQAATGINVGPLTVDGKLDFTSTDLTELNYYLNNTQPVLSIVFTSGSNSLTLQMSKSAFVSPTKLDHGNPYARTTATIKGVANSTDAGTGNAPIKAILVNTRSTAY